MTIYLIGLIPFGLVKIFNLWLYAKEQQLICAKISIKVLIFNIILSLILIVPFKALGLALASSLGGFLNLYLVHKVYRKNI